ncbi:hypothetical protein C8J30_11068 [Rhodobacter viridis]|uniref:Hemolysin type calcium-binding protein n=1 Tax=Rhodobacter viridis TaxID=1054202 RepID=A0A318U479_9RHOB|nr:calcium-binding protein [Rhodobacter viridis]PYF09195.1 hypothetical protein C8J30_11068 [Rhodobacter viridis]
MALIATTTNTISSGVLVTLTSVDHLIVNTNVLLASVNDDAVSSTGGTAQILGTVIGTSAGIRSTGHAFSVFIGATGTVASTGASGTGGLRLSGSLNTVTNQGTVTGSFGVVIGSTDAGITSTIHNSGEISATDTAILRVFGCTDTLRIINTGAINGGTNSDAINANTNSASIEQVLNQGTIAGGLHLFGGADLVVNRGFIDASVFLGTGADSFDGRSGEVTGTVDGGEDDDSFIGNALVNESFDGGDGSDLLDFRFGGAVTVALDNSFSTDGAALGDSYVNFERVLGSQRDDVIRGAEGTNILLGRGGADSLDGAGGNDVLNGGAGIDRLTGGLGNDVFRFNMLAEFGDAITDFGAGAGNNDKFQFDASALGGGLVVGALAAGAFVSRLDNHAQDANDRFIFRTSDTTLWFDADGNGAGAAVMVADLQAGAVVTVADIQLV